MPTKYCQALLHNMYALNRHDDPSPLGTFDVRSTAQTSRNLMERLSGSWVMPLLEGSGPPAPSDRSTSSHPTTARP